MKIFFEISVFKLGVDQLSQLLDSLLFINAVGDDVYSGAADDAQREHAQQALGVDLAVILLDPDAASELIGLLNEESCGSCMQTYLIVYSYTLNDHISHSLYYVLLHFNKSCATRQLDILN